MGAAAAGARRPLPAVRLEVLSEASDPRLLASVLALKPGHGQDRYCLPASMTYPPASADPLRVPFAVMAALDGPEGASGGERVVGFGTLDRHGQLEHLLDEPARGLLLRAFYVGRPHQGRGYGTAAARRARALAHALEPEAQLLVLCVHESNTAARTAYARAGFADSGARWMAQAADPQVVMVAALQPR
ncbi:GNAT family N-acetyltransferase [Streptomyces sp. NP160]|uniref:GNAT family N-acetyltransferase n=1 Tax=Streptomyces sp. NP160 TaxID=2586637 RepID=UPI001118FE9F|nr:GNAT family N-acetyltransferase [Streptomyces sp. NP160]TNM67713.1 GNAT family N-acetyltransferase [Streptomyces sp. NP160]